MQIHELNNFTGTLGPGAYLAIDDGTDTGKISSQGLLAATEARIDNIIAGPAPSAEEIVDARLGADGVTYPLLGDAIRDQFTDVKSAYLYKLGFRANSFSINSGSSHSSTSDRLDFPISSGDVFYVTVSTSVSMSVNAQVYLVDGNGTSTRFATFKTNSGRQRFVAPYGVTKVGVFVATVSSNTDVFVLCETEDSVILGTERTLALENIYRKTGNDDWAIGTIANGDVTSNTKRIVDKTYIPVGLGTVISTSTLQMVVNLYDANKTWISPASSWSKNDYTVLNVNAKFARVILKVSDAHVFTDEELAEYKDTVSVKYSGLTISDALTSGFEVVNAETIRAQSFNSAFHTGATTFATKCEEFSALMKSDTLNDITAPSDIESFLFFTDPHLLNGSDWENRCYEMISQIQKYYNSTPTSFCLCGGDWIGNGDVPASACFKLGYVDGFMHSMFDKCYMLVGNHDTNYQGKKDADSANRTTRLSNQSIADLWYREQGKAYYTFNGANTKFYCFDTGTEQQLMTSFDNYGWEQVAWFGNALLTDNSEHIAITAHILYSDTSHTQIQPLTDYILQIAKAYNSRTSITVNGNTYNYASATGKIEFFIGGHTHADHNVTLYDIPCILSADVRHDESVGSTFDLVLVDYDNSKIHLIRVGSGSNREFDL